MPSVVGENESEREEVLLGMRVSEVIDLDDGVLDLLIRHGFKPLAQTHLRALLAPTVTLSQALRIRGLSDSAQRALLDELGELVAASEQTGAEAADDYDATYASEKPVPATTESACHS